MDEDLEQLKQKAIEEIEKRTEEARKKLAR